MVPYLAGDSSSSDASKVPVLWRFAGLAERCFLGRAVTPCDGDGASLARGFLLGTSVLCGAAVHDNRKRTKSVSTVLPVNKLLTH